MASVNYQFTENGLVYSFDDVFVEATLFRQPALWVWGQGTNSQLGNNQNAGNAITPITTLLGKFNWKNVFDGSDLNTGVIKTDGTLWMSGFSYNGTSDASQRSVPVTTILGGDNWKQISHGVNLSAAIKTDGTLWVWGANTIGELGINSTVSRSTPVTTFIGGNNWKQVSCKAGQYTVAVKNNGTLWSWGINNFGQLGINDAGIGTEKSTPVTTFVGGTNWKSVTSGGSHTLAIKTDGTLWVWGSANNGRLGTNDLVAQNFPVTTILGGNNWKQVSGGSHTAAIKTDGTLWVWGANSYGQLGINDGTQRLTPVTTILGGTNWKYVACGTNHTAAIKTDGTLWLWGRNSYGQLGTNAFGVGAGRTTPVTTILGGNYWVSVSCGTNHTAAIQYVPDP